MDITESEFEPEFKTFQVTYSARNGENTNYIINLIGKSLERRLDHLLHLPRNNPLVYLYIKQNSPEITIEFECNTVIDPEYIHEIILKGLERELKKYIKRK